MNEADGVPLLVKAGTPGSVQLGAILRHIRSHNNMTQGDVAFKILGSISSVSMCERGERAPSPEFIKKVLGAIDDHSQYEFEWRDDEDLDLIVKDTKLDICFGFVFYDKTEPKKTQVIDVIVPSLVSEKDLIDLQKRFPSDTWKVISVKLALIEKDHDT